MSLGNVLAVAYATQKEKLTFLEEEDKVTHARGVVAALTWTYTRVLPSRIHLLSGRDRPSTCRSGCTSCWDMEAASCLSRSLSTTSFCSNGPGFIGYWADFDVHFLQDDKGRFNFDQEKVINPETGEQVSGARWSCCCLGRGL